MTVSAQAASQYFSPSGGTYSAHSSFTVGIYADSSDQPASAFSALIQFPPDQVKITSVSKSGSMIQLWVREPAYSNTSGTLSFEGLIPNPGYQGTGGKLLNVTFEVLGEESANLSFVNGLVLANDGNGTDISGDFGAASFAFAANPAGTALIGEEGDGTEPVAAYDWHPIGRVAGIHTALASAFGLDVVGTDSDEQKGLFKQLGAMQTFELVIFIVFALLLLALVGLVLLALVGLVKAHFGWGGRAPRDSRSVPVSRRLKMINLSTAKHLHDLEKLSRQRNLPKAAKVAVLAASKALVNLEDQLEKSLTEL
ncbi:MAG: hypothetical protein WAZ14_04645 [Patescibacteria group bacterium]